jgi:YD repeat-containing protein
VQHDGARQITRITNPLGQMTTWTYDQGFITTRTNPLGQVTTFTQGSAERDRNYFPMLMRSSLGLHC